MAGYSLPEWHYLYGKPDITGTIRAEPEHFQVSELLPFTPDGEGEHHLLHIEKRGITTHQLVRKFARFSDVPQRDISWAGLKDRHGITRQWLSVRIPGKTSPDWQAFNDGDVKVLESHRHLRKLRTGALLGNRFRIAISNVSDKALLEQRLAQVTVGVPNYFGEQRFGHGGANVERAVAMFEGKRVKDRDKRSLYLSSARSFLFNQVVSKRIAEHGLKRLNGDALLLSGSNSFFTAEAWDDTLIRRLEDDDVQLSAPMVGDGDSPATLEAGAFESEVVSSWPVLVKGLANARLKQERRALLLKPAQFQTQWQDDALWLEFVLPPGAFATSLLRELVCYVDAQSIESTQ